MPPAAIRPRKIPKAGLTSTERPGTLPPPRRVDDPVEDQQHRDPAEHGDHGVERYRRLEVGLGEPHDGDADRDDDRDHQEDRDVVQRVPGVGGAADADRDGPAGRFDAEPVEEHEEEEQGGRGARDLLAHTQFAEVHRSLPRIGVVPTLHPAQAENAAARFRYAQRTRGRGPPPRC
jgi:hypothetical protein